MADVNDITPGSKFNRLTYLREAGRINEKRAALFRCDCGTEKIMRVYAVVTGRARSCGCYHKERAAAANITHGHTSDGKWSHAYTVWSSMKDRCLNPSKRAYPDYGGRGIQVCDRWLDFDNFLADMGEPPDGMSIDRYPNTNGNYEPGNCRWATRVEQNSNRRSCVFIDYQGKRQTVRQWSRELGIHRDTIEKRLRRGITDPSLILKLTKSPS